MTLKHINLSFVVETELKELVFRIFPMKEEMDMDGTQIEVLKYLTRIRNG